MLKRLWPHGTEEELGRLATYQYLGEIIRGRRILEIGVGSGWGVVQWLSLGADHVLGLDADPRALSLQLAGELREAWWNLALARSQQDLAARRAATAQALEADVERRYKAGDLARVDANLARNERLAAQAEALEAAAAAVRSEQTWRTLTGLPPPAALATESLTAETPEHPRLIALQAAARLAHARLRTVRETRRDAPELALRWTRERGASAEPFGHSVGVKFTLPFASEPYQRRNQSAARAEALQWDAEAARARQTLEQEAQTARRQLEAAEQRLALTRQRQPPSADNRARAEKAFALGEADLSHLLRARAAALEAEAALTRQSLERDAAVSRLLQTLGVMP